MDERGENRVEDRTKIAKQMAALSERLGMIPVDGSVAMKNPATHHSMELSEWLETTRHAYFELAVLVGQALDLELQ